MLLRCLTLVLITCNMFNLSAQRNLNTTKWSYQLEYMWDRGVIVLNNLPLIFQSEHQFYISTIYKNKFKLRMMYGIHHAAFERRGSFKENSSWAIGSEYILNERNRKLYFSFGPEYGVSQISNNGILRKTNNISLITRISYNIASNTVITFEPFGFGMGYRQEVNLENPIIKPFKGRGFYSRRFMAIGVALNLR